MVRISIKLKLFKGIVSSTGKRMTLQQSLKTKPGSFKEAVFNNSLLCIFRAGGIETADSRSVTGNGLVNVYQKYSYLPHNISILENKRPRADTICQKLAPTIFFRAIMTRSKLSDRGSIFFIASRICLLSRFLLTAFPSDFPTHIPILKSPVLPGR